MTTQISTTRARMQRSHALHSGSPSPPHGGARPEMYPAAVPSAKQNPRKRRKTLLRRRDSISRPPSNQLLSRTVDTKLCMLSGKPNLPVDEWLFVKHINLKYERHAWGNATSITGTAAQRSVQRLFRPYFISRAWRFRAHPCASVLSNCPVNPTKFPTKNSFPNHYKSVWRLGAGLYRLWILFPLRCLVKHSPSKRTHQFWRLPTRIDSSGLGWSGARLPKGDQESRPRA